MSRVDDLIAEHTTNGVEFRALGDIARFVRGNGMPKTDLVDEGVGAIHYGQIYTRYGAWATETISFVAPETAMKLAKAQPGDIVITNTSENVEDVGKAVAWLGSEPIVIGGHATVIQHDLDPKYLAYWFQSESFSVQKRALATGTKVIDVSARQLAKVRLPAPPIEVQREIVRILDKFTRLEAELEAELEARRRQFGYYRDTLLAADGDAPVVALGEVADFKYGYTDKAAAAGSHRFLRITDITPWGKLSPEAPKYVDADASAEEYVARTGDIFMARTGATFGKTMLFESAEPAVYASFLIRIRFKAGTLLPAFYWHFAQSNAYWDQANALVSTGGQPQFNANVLKHIKVPLPSIDRQERVIALLDRFDALANSLSSGLPAEIHARRKQFAYYRDKLLTFEEAAA